MLLLHELDPQIQGMSSSHPLNSGLSNLVERPPFAKGALFGNRSLLCEELQPLFFPSFGNHFCFWE